MWPSGPGRLPVTVKHTGRRFRQEFARRQKPQTVARLPLLCAAGALLLVLLLLRRLIFHAAPAAAPDICTFAPPVVCAHGGVTTSALANTAPAYRAALGDPNVGCVEVDVSRTREGALVALHTRQLLAISSGEYDSVGDTKLDTLLWYGTAYGETQAVLTLKQSLKALSNRGLHHVVLDLKEGPPAGAEDAGYAAFVGSVLAAVEESSCDECLLWAKEDALVKDLISRGLGSKSGLVVMNQTSEARARGMHHLGRLPGASAAAVLWSMVDAALVASTPLRVFGWTANEEHMADRLIRAGVHAIVTDKVDMVAGRIATLRRGCSN